MRDRSGSDTGCNRGVACVAGCVDGAAALFSERHALDASIAIANIMAMRGRRVVWVTRQVSSYKKRPAFGEGGSVIVEAALETRLPRRGGFSPAFLVEAGLQNPRRIRNRTSTTP
jgi:hypothetical protein